MNYFEFYDLAESFFLSKKQLKKEYLEMSRKFHPDYYTQEDEQAKDKAQAMTALNNKAFEVLSDFNSRVKYILDTNNILKAEGQNSVPDAFLMEVMDINEAIMELQFEPNEEAKLKITEDVATLKENLYAEVEDDMMKYVKDADNAKTILNKVKDYYLKHKYLERIEEQLS